MQRGIILTRASGQVIDNDEHVPLTHRAMLPLWYSLVPAIISQAQGAATRLSPTKDSFCLL